jgi:hypothetical protein
MLSHEVGSGFHFGQQSLGLVGTVLSIKVQGGVPIVLKAEPSCQLTRLVEIVYVGV